MYHWKETNPKAIKLRKESNGVRYIMSPNEEYDTEKD